MPRKACLEVRLGDLRGRCDRLSRQRRSSNRLADGLEAIDTTSADEKFGQFVCEQKEHLSVYVYIT